MRFLVLALLLAAAHFNLTPFAPAEKAWVLWPFVGDSQPIVGGIGGLPQESGSLATSALAGIAGLCFIAAAVSLLEIVVPAGWFTTLAIVGGGTSIALFGLYFSPLSILPVIIDLALLWGVFAQHWTVAELIGG
jgi:hypothetical protein